MASAYMAISKGGREILEDFLEEAACGERIQSQHH